MIRYNKRGKGGGVTFFLILRSAYIVSLFPKEKQAIIVINYSRKWGMIRYISVYDVYDYSSSVFMLAQLSTMANLFLLLSMHFNLSNTLYLYMGLKEDFYERLAIRNKEKDIILFVFALDS